MSRDTEKADWRHIIQSAAFFILFFYAVCFGIEPQLVYHGGGIITNFPVFYYGWDHFQNYLYRPGGLVHYLSDFLIQCLYHQWLGSLVITLQAFLLFSGIQAFFCNLGLQKLKFLSFVPPILLLCIYSLYGYFVNTFTQINYFIVGLGIFTCVRFTKSMSPFAVSLIAIPLTFILFILTGSSAFIVALLCLICELGTWQGLIARLLPMLSWMVALLLTPWLFEWWRKDLISSEALTRFYSFIPKATDLKNTKTLLLHFLCLMGPVVGLVAVIIRAIYLKYLKAMIDAREARISSTKAPSTGTKDKTKTGTIEKSKSFLLLRNNIGFICTTTVLVIGFAVIHYYCHNRSLKRLMKVDYDIYNQLWQKVLDQVPAGESSPYLLCAANQALARLGRLGESLPLNQAPDNLLLYHGRYQADWNVIDVYLDLGFVNMAKHFLAEAIDKYGERPALLRRMALVQLALGNTGTAKIYLRALEKVPFHSSWARDYLDRQQQNPNLKGDPFIDHLREYAPQDNFVMPLAQDQIYRRLLRQNPQNRMACEYLLSYYLLTKNLKAFSSEFKRLDSLGIGKLPRLYQEALILASMVLQAKIENMERYVTDDTLRRWERFVELSKNNRNDPQKSFEILDKEFPGSYFVYFLLTKDQ